MTKKKPTAKTPTTTKTSPVPVPAPTPKARGVLTLDLDGVRVLIEATRYSVVEDVTQPQPKSSLALIVANQRMVIPSREALAELVYSLRTGARIVWGPVRTTPTHVSTTVVQQAHDPAELG